MILPAVSDRNCDTGTTIAIPVLRCGEGRVWGLGAGSKQGEDCENFQLDSSGHLDVGRTGSC